jgi:hypothetical protein
MTMNDATKMAVTLARKGASDEVIALVMEAMAVPTPTESHGDTRAEVAMPTPCAAVASKPLPRSVSRPSGMVRLYGPLLAAIRQRIVARGAIEASAIDLCRQHPVEWGQSLGGREIRGKHARNARGLAGVIANAIRWRGGVVEGVRFCFARVDRKPPQANGGGGGVIIYRVEAV